MKFAYKVAPIEKYLIILNLIHVDLIKSMSLHPDSNNIATILYRVKWGNLELPNKSSVKGKIQVKFLDYNVSVN